MSACNCRLPWTKRRQVRRAAPHRDDPLVVFKTFVRALERLRFPPRGGAPANVGAVREKA